MISSYECRGRACPSPTYKHGRRQESPLQMERVFVELPIGNMRPEALGLQSLACSESLDEFRPQHLAENLVLFQRNDGLVQVLRHNWRLGRISPGVRVALKGRAGIEFAIDAVQPGGQRRGEDEIGIRHTVGCAVLDSCPALSLRRDADVARAVVEAPYDVVRRARARGITLGRGD